MSTDVATLEPVATISQPVENDHPERALDRTLKLAMIVVGLLVTGLVAMASVIQTSGAVIGNGRLSVESNVKRVAHPTGGVIAQVYVKEGDHVRKGQPIMRFDNTVSGGSATSIGQSVEQLLASQARLVAERDDAAQIVFPAALTTNPSPSAKEAMNEALRLFSVRRAQRSAEQSSYRERVMQTRQQIAATSAQMQAAKLQEGFVKPELDSLRTLYARQLVTLVRLNELERTAADLRGTTMAYGSRLAELRSRIGELEQSAIESARSARAQAGQELATVQAQLGDQQVRSIAVTDASERALLRAPYDGVIDKLAFATVGGVAPPMQTIMEVVPDKEPLILDLSISPADVDQLYLEQPTIVRFSGLNAQTTPELNGEVYYIGADRTNDERTGASFYTVRVRVSEAELKKLGDLKLKSGMPAEAFMQTRRRSLLSYLTKPLIDQFNRAFRE
jgi:HlyD family secretion protein